MANSTTEPKSAGGLGLAGLAARFPAIADLTKPAVEPDQEPLPVGKGLLVALAIGLIATLGVWLPLVVWLGTINHRQIASIIVTGGNSLVSAVLVFYLLRACDRGLRGLHRRWRRRTVGLVLRSPIVQDANDTALAGLERHPEFAALFFVPPAGHRYVRRLPLLPAIVWLLAGVGIMLAELGVRADSAELVVFLIVLMGGWLLLGLWGTLLDLLAMPPLVFARIAWVTAGSMACVALGTAVMVVLDDPHGPRIWRWWRNDGAAMVLAIELFILLAAYALPIWLWTLYAGGRAVQRHLRRQSLLQRAEDGGMPVERTTHDAYMAQFDRPEAPPIAATTAELPPPLDQVALAHPELQDILIRPDRGWRALWVLMILVPPTALAMSVSLRYERLGTEVVSIVFAALALGVVAALVAWLRIPIRSVLLTACASMALGYGSERFLQHITLAMAGDDLETLYRHSLEWAVWYFLVFGLVGVLRHVAFAWHARLRWRWARRAGIDRAGEVAPDNPLQQALLRHPSLTPWFVIPPVRFFFSAAVPIVSAAATLGFSALDIMDRGGSYANGYYIERVFFSYLVLATIVYVIAAAAGIAMDLLRAPRGYILQILLTVGLVTVIVIFIKPALTSMTFAALNRSNGLDWIVASTGILLLILVIRFSIRAALHHRRRAALYDQILDGHLDPDDLPAPPRYR